MILMLAAFMALQSLSTDIMLPALGAISHDLGTTDANHRQLVVGAYLISSGLGSLFPGMFADSLGRRPVLLTCLGSYILFSLAAGISTSFDMLLVCRALAGFLSSGLVVLGPSMVRDRYEGDKMARFQSTIATVFLLVPMIAPSIGQGVLLFANWRWVFGVVALLGASVWLWAWQRMPETLDPSARNPIVPAKVAANMRLALTNRTSIGYVFGQALVTAMLYGFLNSSQQLIAEHFGAGALFPIIFAGMAIVSSLANFANSRMVTMFGARRIAHTGICVMLVMSAIQLVSAKWLGEPAWLFTLTMTVSISMMGLTGANMQSIALQPFGRMAGVAVSSQVFVRLVTGAMLGATIGQFYDRTSAPLSAAMVLACCAILALVAISERGRLFTR